MEWGGAKRKIECGFIGTFRFDIRMRDWSDVQKYKSANVYCK